MSSSRGWGPPRPAVGFAPKLSDAELATLAVVQVLSGFDSEARFVRYAEERLTPWFPYLPGRSGYRKRLRRSGQLMQHVLGALARDCPSLSRSPARKQTNATSGQVVATLDVSNPYESQLKVREAPSGEVTVDVLNIGDDSLLGFRLLVFATPEAEDWMSEDPGPFTLRTVKRTILCHSHRGVTADGLCG